MQNHEILYLTERVTNLLEKYGKVQFNQAMKSNHKTQCILELKIQSSEQLVCWSHCYYTNCRLVIAHLAGILSINQICVCFQLVS